MSDRGLGESRATREYRITSCAGKVPFVSAKLAHEVNKRRTGRGMRGTVYRCRVCGVWHIGGHARDVRR